MRHEQALGVTAHSRRHRVASGSTAIVLTAGLLGIPFGQPAAAGGPSGPIDLERLELDTSIAEQMLESPDAPVVVTGTVTENRAPQDDATIVARVWPKGDELAAVPMNAPVDVKVVDVTYTDQEGRFEIRLDPALVPKTHSDVGGSIHLELWALHDGLETPWHLSVKPSDASGAPASWTTTALEQSGDAGPTDIAFELGDAPNVLQHDDQPSEWITDDGQTLAEAAAAGRRTVSAGTTLVENGGLAVQPTATPCWSSYPYGGQIYRNNRERFMYTYAWTGAPATVSQAIGSSSGHTLGVAYKPVGGSWAFDGTADYFIGQDAGQTKSGLINRGIYNSVNYRMINCSAPTDNTLIIGQLIAPVSFYDIFNEPTTYTGHTTYRYGCVEKVQGDIVTKSRTTSVTHATGVTTPFISLSARSGYNQGTHVRFDVRQDSEICGNHPDGWLKSSAVEIHQQ